MTINASKILSADLLNKGVCGLPDTPLLTCAEMQAKFDELSVHVVTPKHNDLIDALYASTAANEIGASTGTVQSNIDDINAALLLKAAKNDVLEKDNTSGFTPTGDYQPATKKYADDAAALKANAADVLTKTNTDEFTPTSAYHPATKKYIDDAVIAAGAGDMLKAVYDTNSDGCVDDSERLGGEQPTYYLDYNNFTGTPAASDATPAALGTAAAGSATAYSRADHVHALPTLAALGAQKVITSGTTDPTGGNDGDIYLKYEV